MNPRSCPGYGDEATWPEYAGHPNDPRASEPPEWELMTDAQRREELEQLPKDELIAMLLLEFRR